MGADMLSGPLSAGVGDMASLMHVSVNDNSLSGSLPAVSGNMGSLTYLSADNNQITGSLPAFLPAFLPSAVLGWVEVVGVLECCGER